MTKVTQMSFDDSRRRLHLREISGDSESPLETVGQDLRAARLRRGDDLATVSRALKIRKDHLEAVEEDNFACLPGKTYAIGFVRSYSGYLGLDVAKTVERYKQEVSGRQELHHPTDPALHVDESRILPSGWRIVAGIVGLALIYGVWHLLSAGPTAQPVPPPPSLNPRPARVATVAKAAPAPAAPVAGGNIATPPPASTASGAIPASPPAAPQAASQANGSLATASNAAAPTQQVAKPPPAVPAVSPQNPAPGQLAGGPVSGGQGKVYGSLNQNPRVVLHTSGAVSLTVKGADGTLYLNADLKPGDSYQVPNQPGLTLATSNAGAVDVTVDGKPLGKVGENQQVLGRVSLEPASLVDRFNSH